MPADPLVSFLRKRTRRRFTLLVRAAREEVLNAAYRVLADRDDAEDVTQEVFLKLLTVKWDPEKVRCGRALLASQAVRTALARIRGESRRAEREQRFAVEKAARPRAAPVDQMLDVRDAILKLPDDLRTCVELRYFGGLALGEVASALDSSLTSTKDRLKQAREILKTSLAPLATSLLGFLVSEEAKAQLPSIAASVKLVAKLDELAKDGTAMARVAGKRPVFASAKLVVPAAVAMLLSTVTVAILLQGPGEKKEPPEDLAVATTPLSQAAGPVPAENAALPAKTEEPPPAQSPPKPYRVLGPDDKPLAGAQVSLIALLSGLKHPAAPREGKYVESEGFLWWVVSAESGALGDFELSELAWEDAEDEKQNLWLIAKKEGYFPYERVLLYRPPAGFQLKMEKAPEITIRVLHEDDDSPVTRYHIQYDPTLNSYGGRKRGPLRDPSLEVDVDDPEGRFRLVPWNTAWAQNVTVKVNDLAVTARSHVDRELTFLVSRPRQISGVVADTEGNPIAGAEVHACNYQKPLEVAAWDWKLSDGSDDHGGPVVVSSPDGTFNIASLPNETWLVALHEKMVPAVYHVPKSHSLDPIRLTLGRGGSVRLERLDGEDKPVARERITLYITGMDEEPPQGLVAGQLLEWAAFRTDTRGFRKGTDEHGVALFQDLPPGYYFWLEQRTSLEVKAGETTSITDRDPLRKDEPASASQKTRVRGRITVGGEPLKGQVFIAHQSARLDSDGRYELEAIPPGVHYIQSPNNYPGLPHPNSMIRFEVSPGQRERELNWDFPLREVQGRVFAGESGKPPQGATVEILMLPDVDREDVQIAAISITKPVPDEEGAFAYKYLTTGDYVLLSRARGYEMGFESFAVSGDTPATVSLEMHLKPSRMSLYLRLVDASSGETLSPSMVSFTRHGYLLMLNADNFPPGQVDHLEWTGLPPGTYGYGVVADYSGPHGFAYDSVTIHDGDGPIEKRLAIPPGGSLAVEVRNTSGRRFADPLPAAELTRADGQPAALPIFLYLHRDIRVHRVNCEEPGLAWFPHLPVGMYNVKVARNGSVTATEVVEVRKGETSKLKISLSR